MGVVRGAILQSSKSLRRFKSLWALCALLSTALLSFNLLQTSRGFKLTRTESRELGPIGFLDRQTLAFKQEVEEQFFPKRYRVSREVFLIEFNYPNRSDFWFDEKAKHDLARALKNHPGWTILNIDPHRLAADPTLSPILENPKIIRGFSLFGSNEIDVEKENFVSKNITEHELPNLSRPIEIIPKDKNYYRDDHSYGTSMLGVDLYSHFIYEFPLLVPASKRLVPTNSLSAFMRYRGFEKVEVLSEDRVRLDQSLELPRWLPLRFYSQNFLRIDSPEKVDQAKEGILIVEIKDLHSSLLNLKREKVSWSVIAATALSNLLQGHSPLPKPWANVLLLVLCVSGALLIMLASSLKLRTLILVFVLSLFVFVTADFVVSVIFSIRTYPLEEILVLFLFGVVGITTRSIVESDERRIFERALSGYVSEQRLQRLIGGKEVLQLHGREMSLTTMLFDLAGFSKISKTLNPSQTFELIQQVFARTDPIIFKHGGVIDKKTGDGFLAFFGDDDVEGSDPKRVQGAAKRACLAALEIQSSLTETPIRVAGQTVGARIGVNSGKMMIGNAGSSLHFNYTVIGDAVNFTQRLEAACPTGGVMVGPGTQQLVHQDFICEAQKISVKGLSDLQEAYLLKS